MAQTHTDVSWAEGRLRYRNAQLCQAAIPWVFRCVLRWSCRKEESMSYLDYINSLRCTSFSKMELKNIYNQSDIKHLDDKDSEKWDTTCLYKVIKQIGALSSPAPATPAAASPSWDTLDALLKQCKDKRNAAAHEVTTTAVSESYFSEVKPLLEELLDTGADYFGVTSYEKKRVADELDKILNVIENGKFTNETYFDIKEKFLREGKKEMAQYWMRFKTAKLFFSSDVEVDVKSVYNPVVLKQWEEASADAADGVTGKDFEAGNIFGKWPGGSNENIKLLSGDPGSGKTFLTKIIFLSWLGIIKVIFDKLQEFELLLYMQCRNDQHASIKGLIKANYPQTCLGLDMDKVVDAFTLPGTRILYVIDGVDEHNVRSKRLLEDILDQFTPDTMNTCLLTSRPHEVESVKRLLYDRRLSYQGCTITELTEERQVKSLERLQNAVPQSSLCSSQFSADPLTNIVESFKNIEIKSVFQYPLNLNFFCDLNLNKPYQVADWTKEADVMHAMYNFYIEVTIQKLEENNCAFFNVAIIIRHAFVELGKYCLELFQNQQYCFSKSQYQNLIYTLYEKISRDVDCKTLLSVILRCETDAQGRETGIYNFPHRSVQEHLQAMAVIASWEEDCRRAADEARTVQEEASIAATLVKMIQSYQRVYSAASTSQTPDSTKINKSDAFLQRLFPVFGEKRKILRPQRRIFDFSRYDKTIQFIILELLRTHRPRAEDNIKSLAALLRQSGVKSFQYWMRLVSGSRLHPVVVHEAAVAVDTACWRVGPRDVKAADVVLTDIKRCGFIMPARVVVEISPDVATPDTVSSLLRTIGDVGGKMKLDLWLWHSMHNFVPCDALLNKLNNSPVLEVFLGCLITPGRVLAPLITPDTRLYLALADQDHDLDRIRDRGINVLEVSLQCPSSASRSYPFGRPLPRASHNNLHLLNIRAGEWEWPYQCLTALVPEDKGYDMVKLVNCSLADADLDELQRRAVHTKPLESWKSSWKATRDWSDGTRDIRL